MACDWLLIDGPSLIFRAYYGTLARSGPRPRAQGNAIGSALDRLAALITQRRPGRIALAEDRAWRPGWRVELIDTYKAHRVAEPVPPALAPQIPLVYELLGAMGIDVVGVDDHEAEDVIASLARLADGTVEIASGDRDLFALVEDPRVRVLYPERAGLAVIDESEVTRRYGVPGRRYADFAILRGDPSDGLPGLRGVGSVSAAGLIRHHGDLDGVLRERRLSDGERDYVERARRVVTPVADLPLALPAGRRSEYPADPRGLAEVAERCGVTGESGRLVAALSRLATG